MKFHIFHDWTEWEIKKAEMFTVIDGKKYVHQKEYQERVCKICGYIEREKFYEI